MSVCRPVALYIPVAIMFNLSISIVQVQNIIMIDSQGYLEQVRPYIREYLLLTEMKKCQHFAYEIMTITLVTPVATLMQQQSRYIFNLD
jgi:hypothetical protein